MGALRLRTLGGLVLLVDDEPTTGTVTQRRRLALLALLAVARKGGLARDKILAYLWPESDAERARHSLEQLLYLQRRRAPGEQLFLGRKTLRLNPTVMTTDVGEFEDALDRGELETAARLYTGPFLDGFFLRGAPEFEEWVEGQRVRLLGHCTAALHSLAQAAAARGDQSRAIEWWRKAMTLNPFDAETAISLVQALDAAGNQTSALREADAYQERLRDKLGLGPEPRLERLARQFRGERT